MLESEWIIHFSKAFVVIYHSLFIQCKMRFGLRFECIICKMFHCIRAFPERVIKFAEECHFNSLKSLIRLLALVALHESPSTALNLHWKNVFFPSFSRAGQKKQNIFETWILFLCILLRIDWKHVEDMGERRTMICDIFCTHEKLWGNREVTNNIVLTTWYTERNVFPLPGFMIDNLELVDCYRLFVNKKKGKWTKRFHPLTKSKHLFFGICARLM